MMPQYDNDFMDGWAYESAAAASIASRVGTVCDSCIDAVMEFGVVEEEDEAAENARQCGLEISDHLCDAREGSQPSCACGCNEVVKGRRGR